MDEKTPLLRQRDPSPSAASSVTRRIRYYIFSLVLSVSLILFVFTAYTPPTQCGPARLRRERDSKDLRTSPAAKVPLEAHIMSKCPDAQSCLNDLILPAMSNISTKVDFKLSYIGEIDDQDGGVECKHGPSECMGNIVQLCAADLYPDPKTYLPFATCLTNEYESIPDEGLVKGCALEHGIDFEKLNECASRDDGAYGQDLLRESVNRTAKAGVKYSCTVRLDDEVRCIRDGGEWKNCDGGSKPKDLIRDVIAASK